MSPARARLYREDNPDCRQLEQRAANDFVKRAFTFHRSEIESLTLGVDSQVDSNCFSAFGYECYLSVRVSEHTAPAGSSFYEFILFIDYPTLYESPTSLVEFEFQFHISGCSIDVHTELGEASCEVGGGVIECVNVDWSTCSPLDVSITVSVDFAIFDL